MNRPLGFAPRYTHIGGDVFSAVGRKVDLADAVEFAGHWGCEALRCEAAGAVRLARLYARDALAIHLAAAAAWRWRRAAGHPDPFATDRRQA